MKIAVNVKYFSPRGGAQTYLAYLVEGLLAGGHEVEVYAMEFASDFPGVRAVPVSVGPLPRALRDWAFASKSARLLREADHDVVFGEQKLWHLDVVRPGGGAWGQYFEREMRSLRGQWWRVLAKRLSLKEKLAQLAEKRLYACPRLKRVIVNSEGTKAALLGRYPLEAGRIHVVRNGVDAERYHPQRRAERRTAARERLGLVEGDYVLLFLARNFRLKGLAPLLEALASAKASLAPRPVKLLAVGQRRPRRFGTKARALGLFGDVQFHGPARRPDDFYAAADVLAHPTFHDPCANVCLEAMAMGLPAVTTLANGASELMEHGRSGMVVEDAWDVPALAECFVALADPAERERMGRAARKAAEGLTPERNCERVCEVFEMAMEEARGDGAVRSS